MYSRHISLTFKAAALDELRVPSSSSMSSLDDKVCRIRWKVEVVRYQGSKEERVLQISGVVCASVVNGWDVND